MRCCARCCKVNISEMNARLNTSNVMDLTDACSTPRRPTTTVTSRLTTLEYQQRPASTQADVKTTHVESSLPSSVTIRLTTSAASEVIMAPKFVTSNITTQDSSSTFLSASNAWDAHYCDKWSCSIVPVGLLVSLSVTRAYALKNSWTNREIVWGGYFWGPRYIVLDGNSDPPRARGWLFDAAFATLLCPLAGTIVIIEVWEVLMSWCNSGERFDISSPCSCLRSHVVDKTDVVSVYVSMLRFHPRPQWLLYWITLVTIRRHHTMTLFLQ